MTTLIRDILLRDPAKEGLVNNGQARITNELADEHVLAELRGELSTFVCEGEYAEGIIKILSSYLANRSQANQKAAWVSGFFGSGKSHLLKMLAHLWMDTQLPNGDRQFVILPETAAEVGPKTSAALSERPAMTASPDPDEKRIPERCASNALLTMG